MYVSMERVLGTVLASYSVGRTDGTNAPIRIQTARGHDKRYKHTARTVPTGTRIRPIRHDTVPRLAQATLNEYIYQRVQRTVRRDTDAGNGELTVHMS